MTDQEYTFLKNKIYALTSLDVNCYKPQQMRRRLEAFVVRKGNMPVTSFCSDLEKSPEKQKELLDYLAINVSEFFRDINQFATLRSQVIPQLLSKSRRLNIWSAASSAGQEPYSVAMILEEINPGYNHRILATDIDQSALLQARNGGPYLQLDVKNVAPGILEKYFLKKENGFWVNDTIKKKITFQRLNLLKDSFEENFDLIICRNVIIYFSDPVKDDLFKKFHDSLKEGGVLFLGGSEVVLKPSAHGFSMLTPAFYRKMAGSNRAVDSVRDLSEVPG
jgi:chemotaxis protein methyltransferase CheR